MKELKVISLENGVILSENLVKGSILPRTSAELERDVLIQNDTIVEGAIYARKLEIQNGDVEILGAVFTKLEFHISNNAKGDIILRKTVATSDSLVSYARDCRPMFMADINGKTVKLCNAFVAGSIFADEVILEDCIVLGGVFATAKLTMKDCIVGTFNAKNVAVSGDIKLLLPSAFSGEEMQVTSEARLFNLSLADLGALYKGTPEMENTGIIEMNTYSDEQESQLFEGDEKVLVHCYSVVGKVLAADLVNVDKLRNHFLIGATALGSQLLKTYDLGVDANGELCEIIPEKVADFFFNLLHGKIQVRTLEGSFSIQEIAQRKVKIQHRFLLRKFPRFFQKFIHLGGQPHKVEGQRSHTVQNLVVLTLTFHFQHGFVAFVQDTADRTAVRFHDPLHCKHVFFVQIGTVHLPAAIHEVMCLIHQEQIVSLYPLLKKAFQIYIRIEYVIVITDNIVRPGCHIQTHLKRAHLIFFRLR